MNNKNKLYYQNHRIHVEIAVCTSLFLLVIFFQFMPKMFNKKKPELVAVHPGFILEDVPLTEQILKRGVPHPARPIIPVQAEENIEPEDEDLTEFDLMWPLGNSNAGTTGYTRAGGDTLPPRPLLQVMPEYSNEMQKNGKEGIVKLYINVEADGTVSNVVVSHNSTGSDKCRSAAVEAAYKSKYIPARSDNRNISMWTTCVFTFKKRLD